MKRIIAGSNHSQHPSTSLSRKRQHWDEEESARHDRPPKKHHSNLDQSQTSQANVQCSTAPIHCTNSTTYYQITQNQVVSATSQLRHLYNLFVTTMWPQTSVPYSCTLLGGDGRVRQGEENMNKHLLQRKLLHNVTSSSRIQEFFARYHLPNQPDTFSEDDLYSFPLHHHHYQLSISPHVNYGDKQQTKIVIDGRGTYTFEGFSLVSQERLDNVPLFWFQRYGYNYRVKLEPMPESIRFTVMDALLFEEYVFNELLQLYGWTQVLKSLGKRMLFVPLFSKSVPGGGVRVLPVADVLQWLVHMRKPLVAQLEAMMKEKTRKEMSRHTDGWLVSNPDRLPSCIRIDRLEWPTGGEREATPSIIHFSSVFNENEEETKECPEAVHSEEFHRASKKEVMLGISADCFYSTGIYTDIVQHVLVLPLLTGHILFHGSLSTLEDKIHYRFKDRQLLQRALTHASYSPSAAEFGEEIRVTSSNCALHRPEGKSIGRKEGAASIAVVVEQAERQSEEERMKHNEQLEFLGDATLEFLCSLHLYHVLPNARVGQLALYRTVLVKNKHLAVLASKLGLREFMLLGDVHSSEERSESPPGPSSEATRYVPTHMDANTMEALLGAVYLDGGLGKAQELTARLFFPEDVDLFKVWMHYPPDSLQSEHSEGDRHLIPQSLTLQQMVSLEESVGVKFTHIRLLARAFTHSSVGYTSLVGGNYEKLEHLGDAVLQFIVSDFVYHKFPTLHEGHLSLLRTTLVHNKQLAKVSRQLGFDKYIRKEHVEVGGKILADVVESYLAALLLDKGLPFCKRFLEICLFPKLSEAVKSSVLEDPNTQLQKAAAQLCRRLNLKQEIPYYRVLKTTGSASSPHFTIAVYFKGYRLGVGSGLSHREARQKAAESALQNDTLNEQSHQWLDERQHPKRKKK